MSRALNLDASSADVLAMCAKHKAGITQIESLPAGGTRVVVKTADSAAILTRAFKGKILHIDTRRAPTRLMHG